MYVGEPATSEHQALLRANYAVKAGPGLWMPFDSPDHGWVIERFSGHGLGQRAQWEQWLAEWIAGVVEHAEPAIRSDFDVYYEDDRLLYTGSECGDEDLEPPFFLHVFPVNEDDLPAALRRHGFDNLDFRFEAIRLPLDSYFKDVPALSGVGCAVLVELPGYEVARIRTGQFVRGGPQLWVGEFEIGGGKAP